MRTPACGACRTPASHVKEMDSIWSCSTSAPSFSGMKLRPSHNYSRVMYSVYVAEEGRSRSVTESADVQSTEDGR